jgi:hypothetical protein
MKAKFHRRSASETINTSGVRHGYRLFNRSKKNAARVRRTFKREGGITSRPHIAMNIRAGTIGWNSKPSDQRGV